MVRAIEEQMTNVVETSDQSPNLPQEIIFEILLRLPVKTLLRFRCVSKSWRSLISDPFFVRKHLYKSSSDGNHTNHSVILRDRCPDSCFGTCSVYSIFREQTVVALNPGHLPQNWRRYEFIAGSCHGLLCIVQRCRHRLNIVYLWNPATRESMRLPKSGLKPRKVCDIMYGFGYDLSSHDYRVVAVLTCLSENDFGRENKVIVYSLRTNSWRKIENYPYEQYFGSHLYLNGALHWLGLEKGEYRFWKIFGHDLATDKYLEIPQPDCGGHGNDLYFDLGCLGGCLCLIANYQRTCVDLWVMKEYGVQESWTKLITVPYLMDPCHAMRYTGCSPLAYSENGELLLYFLEELLLYNPKNNSFRSPVIMRDSYAHFTHGYDTDVYVESLVSPNAEDRI